MPTTKPKQASTKPSRKSKFRCYGRGTFLVKDLNDILVEPNVKSSEFIYSKYLTTVVVIVPISNIHDFEEHYELLTDNVVPKSARRLNVPEKDGLSIWYSVRTIQEGELIHSSNCKE